MKVDRIALLELENHNLRIRIEELESLCGLNMKPRVKLPIARSKRVAMLLGLLLKKELVTRDAVLMALGKDDCSRAFVDVHVSHARKLLAEWCIPLKTDWGNGWYVEKKYKDALRANLTGEKAKAA